MDQIKPLSRREALSRISLLTTSAFLLKPLRAHAKIEAGKPTFTFAALNDLHHDSPDCDEWFRDVFAQVSSHRPDIVFLLGDLAHRGLQSSHEAIFRLSSTIGAPVYTVPGNHDNDVHHTTDLYLKTYPGRDNYHFVAHGWQVLCLDTTAGNQWEAIEVPTRSLEWLRTIVATLSREMPTLFLTHFPLGPDLRTIHGHLMTPRNAPEVLALLEPLNVCAVFSGHFHGHSQRLWSKGTEMVTGPCCSRVDNNHDGTTLKGWWFCCAFSNGQVQRRFIPLAVSRAHILHRHDARCRQAMLPPDAFA
jgi:predicted phosphodiesterase